MVVDSRPHTETPTVASRSKEDRFRRLAEQRVNAILDKMRLLGQLSNRRNYTYTSGQTEAIFLAISRELRATKAKFGQGERAEKKFEL